jgi:hypothetical protein
VTVPGPGRRRTLFLCSQDTDEEEKRAETVGAALASGIMTLPLCDGADDKLLKDFEVNIAELANVETSLAHLVLPEF